MQLTRYTDYSLRILIYLALLPEGQKASIDEISQVYAISRNNINKIVHQLGKSAIIETKRGKGGGFFLKLKPSEINIGDIVLLMENSLQIIDCEKPVCRILPVCKLRGILEQATTAFVESLKQYTLADLLYSRETQLIQILQLKNKE